MQSLKYISKIALLMYSVDLSHAALTITNDRMLTCPPIT